MLKIATLHRRDIQRFVKKCVRHGMLPNRNKPNFALSFQSAKKSLVQARLLITSSRFKKNFPRIVKFLITYDLLRALTIVNFSNYFAQNINFCLIKPSKLRNAIHFLLDQLFQILKISMKKLMKKK